VSQHITAEHMPFYAEFYALFNKIFRYFCHDLAISTGFAAVNI